MNRKLLDLIGLTVLLVVGLLAFTHPYMAQNLSSAPNLTDWQQVNLNGFGNPATTGVSALETINGQLYAATSDWTNGGQVWLTTDGTLWTPISERGFSSTYTTTNPAILDLVEFKGQVYACTGWHGTPGQVWRSPGGSTWEQVVGDGFGNPANQSVSTFTVYSDTLYAATGNLMGIEVWRSSTGDSLSWTPVITGGLGYTTNLNVTGYIVFNDLLYIATEGNQDHFMAPIQVWRSGDGAHWDAMTTDGFGVSHNISASGLAILNGYLYLGTRNDLTGAQLWRTPDGQVWEPIVADGFGDVNNVKIESLTTFDGYLFAVTMNEVTGVEVWRSPDGVAWDQISLDGFGDDNNTGTFWSNATAIFQSHYYVGTWNFVTGGEVWRYSPQTQEVFLPFVKR